MRYAFLAAVVLAQLACGREPPSAPAPPGPSVAPPPPDLTPAATAPARESRDPRALITIHLDGSITARIAGEPACPTRQPADCGSELARRQPPLPELTLRAEPAVTYQLVVDAIDALHPSGASVVLDAPPGARVAPCAEPAAADARAAPPAPDDSKLVISISRTLILVGQQVALQVPAFTAEGVPAAHKRCGKDDAFIVPLADLLPRPEQPRDVVVVADRNTPYRVLWEVFHTAQRTVPGKVQLLTSQRAH